MIKDDINESNAAHLYSQAYSMKMDELKTALEKFIVDKILKGDNATQFYIEAIKVC